MGAVIQGAESGDISYTYAFDLLGGSAKYCMTLQEGILLAMRDKYQNLYSDIFHFDLTEKWANELLRLVLIGQKRATASSLWAYEFVGDEIPKSGYLSIVTDWEGDPRCVIETTKITVIPFPDITYGVCKRKGEDDRQTHVYIMKSIFRMPAKLNHQNGKLLYVTLLEKSDTQRISEKHQQASWAVLFTSSEALRQGRP